MKETTVTSISKPILESTLKPFSFPALRFDAGGLSPLEQDNARLYDYHCRLLAHQRAEREAQIEAWAKAQKDALDEAFAVACILPCSLTQARAWQADETHEGRTRWAACMQEVKTSRQIDAPPPLTVVNTAGEFLRDEGDQAAEGDRATADTGGLTARQWTIVALLFLLAAGLSLLLWPGLWGRALSISGLGAAIITGYQAWAMAHVEAAAGEEGDEVTA